MLSGEMCGDAVLVRCVGTCGVGGICGNALGGGGGHRDCSWSYDRK